ncbi:MAG: tetratricopeptide repeat protein [Saprospiraceae bacterium]
MNKYFWIIALLALTVSACTTQKKKGDLSGLGKMWHNTTAHYNGYFNADEIITNSTLALAEQHEDNYLEVLDIYPYTEVDNAQSVASEVDEAIKKVTVVVNLHPYSQWSDDCYLLAGKGLYLKQDYEGAEKAFRFLLNEYPPETDEPAAKGKKGGAKGKASAGKGSGKGATTSAGLPGEKPMTAAERAKARKKYNREVAKRKKQREKDRRKGKTTSAPKKTTETPKPEATATPDATTPAPATEPAGEPERIGPVRLSDDPSLQADTDGGKNPIKHRPAFQEGQLWLARALTQRDNYEPARRLLNQLEQSGSTYSDIRREAAVAIAHLNIREKNYAQAVQALDKAIDRVNDRNDRARYAFIQGQLQQELGNYQGAFTAYEKVVRLRPEYEMEFAARLKMAQNSYLSGSGSAEEAIANLESLLKDEKNEAYKDQIYFAMATVLLAQGNEEEGVAMLQQSLGASLSNRAQKTEAYYLLGGMYYRKEAFLEAKLYYDSTLMVMAALDERYLPTERLRNNLVEIAKHLETITLQDSLLMIAEWSPEEQAKLAKSLYEQSNAQTNASTSGTDKFNPAGTTRIPLAGAPSAAGPALRTESSFFAYDERAIKRGAKEFSRRWGNRSLEDNWRRSNRMDAGIAIEETEAAEEVDVNLLTQEQIDKILKDVPKTDGEKEGARLEIKKSLYELGRLYRDRLGNNEKCVATLETLNARFSSHLHELDSWYYLYLAHTDLGNTAQANEYKQKILSRYPSSSYGQILQNPNYAQEYLDAERQFDKSYNAVYELFEAGRYQETITQAQANVAKLSGKHPLKARYALLMAMSTGSIGGKDAYIVELQKVIGSYPDTPEETRAKEIVRLLGGAGASLPGRTQEKESAFTVNDADLHYVIIFFESDEVDLNALKVRVSDYNETYHSLDKLKISNVYLGQGNNIPVLVLRRFKDKDAAMAYYTGIQKNSNDFIERTPHKVYPISQGNYREILRNRSVDGYDSFFENNYK